VVNSGGFQIGQTVIIGAPAKEEIQVIKAFFFDANSGLSFMIFESPLNYDHPIGVMIALFTSGTYHNSGPSHHHSCGT